MTDTRPNILWICTDQQRTDTLGFNGNAFVKTPRIDALKNESVNFSNCFVQSPICMPSRGSFMTGRYPRTTRLRQSGQNIPKDEIPVTKFLSEAGYYCGLAGKFHLNPVDPRFFKTEEERIDDGYAEFSWAGEAASHWGDHSAYTKFLSDRGITFKTTPRTDCSMVNTGMPVEVHETMWCAKVAAEFMERRKNEDTPWMFSANLFAPHHPFDPPAEMLERYLDIIDDLPLPASMNDDLTQKPPYQAFDIKGAYGQLLPYKRDISDYDHRLLKAAYWAMCDLVDMSVGRMLDALEASGQADNTIVIFTSDHGEMLGDHGIYLKGPYFYDALTRVPFIIRLPNKIKARDTDKLLELVDVAPTLMEACGLDAYPGMQGISIWPELIGNKPIKGRDSIYCEYYNAAGFHRDPEAHLTMTRTKTHKIVVDHSHDGGELYDMIADPNEVKNLWSEPAALELKAEMLVLLTHRMANTVDPLPAKVGEW